MQLLIFKKAKLFKGMNQVNILPGCHQRKYLENFPGFKNKMEVGLISGGGGELGRGGHGVHIVSRLKKEKSQESKISFCYFVLKILSKVLLQQNHIDNRYEHMGTFTLRLDS